MVFLSDPSTKGAGDKTCLESSLECKKVETAFCLQAGGQTLQHTIALDEMVFYVREGSVNACGVACGACLNDFTLCLIIVANVRREVFVTPYSSHDDRTDQHTMQAMRS